jgi:hypothetical protein
MQKKTANIVRMLKSTALVLEQNQPKWATSVVLSKSVPTYIAMVAKIPDAAVSADKTITGTTTTKNELRDELEEEVYLFSSPLLSIANYEKNSTMAKSISFSETKLSRIKEADLITTAKTVLNLAKANLKKLEDYSIKPDDAAKLEAMVTNFNEVQTSPRSETSTRAAARGSMDDIVNEAKMLLLSQIDLQMESIRRHDPEFYNAYQSARKIINVGIRHIKKKDPKKAENENAENKNKEEPTK